MQLPQAHILRYNSYILRTSENSEETVLNKDIFVQKYLERIKFEGNALSDLNTLMKIHRQHLLNIPFENLDIIDNKKIEFDIERIWTKIVEQKRGGICYELNGLLYHLLVSIGFEVKYISAKVLQDGNQFDHVLLIVILNSDKFLVDIGFGDNFLEPIKFEVDTAQKDLKGYFKIVGDKGDFYQLLKSVHGSEYSLEYTFTLEERSLDEFKERCSFFETSPHSRFKRNRLCSLEKENGRVSLKDDKLIITENGERIEKEIKNLSEFLSNLKQFFNITINGF